eukprot:979203-Prorocentrum_lima.AAC.1
MTSSLVGSEMCIRDRCNHEGRVDDHIKGNGRAVRQCLPFPRTSRTRKATCLLYTSDAADDM